MKRPPLAFPGLPIQNELLVVTGSTQGAVAGGLFGLFWWFPPPQFPDWPAQDKLGFGLLGPVTEFAASEQPTRTSARRALRGRRARMVGSFRCKGECGKNRDCTTKRSRRAPRPNDGLRRW
jgi:hypothetical protein